MKNAFLVFLCCIQCCIAQQLKRVDSLKMDAIYEEAVAYSDREPLKAGITLEKLLVFLNDTVLITHPDNYYAQHLKAKAQHYLAYFKRRESKHDESLSLLLKSIELKKSIKDTLTIPKSLNQIGLLWMYQSQDEQAESYLLEALALSKEYGTHTETLSILSNLGTAYSKLSKLEKAERAHQEAMRLADSLQDVASMAATNANYALFLRKQGNYAENIPYVEKAIAYHREKNNKIGLESGWYALAYSYRQMGKNREAIPMYLKAIALAEELGSQEYLPYRYLGISKAYTAIGDDTNALAYYTKYSEAKLNRNEREVANKMADMEMQHQLKRQQALDSLKFEETRLRSEMELNHRANSRFWTVVIIVLVLFGIVGFLFLRNRQRVKEQAYQNILLNKKVATKTEEINELLTETIQHIKSKERLAENLQKLSQEKEGITLKSIIADLKASKADHAKLMLIKQNIEHVNFGFIKKLKSTHPNLTKTDIEICSFIRIGLRRKEIANLRNTSLEAVKSSRFRIKKKLALSASDDLDTYINSL